MTHRQRLLAALRGRETDRLPWSPLLAYWWETQDEQLQRRGQKEYILSIGGDPLLRGFHELFRVGYDGCTVTQTEDSGKRVTVYETPAGTLHAVHTYVREGNTWFLTEHPVKTEEDFKILTCLNERMTLAPNYEQFLEDDRALGDDGLYLPLLGPSNKTSFQALLEYWVGTENLAYALEDYPEAIEECLAAMRKNSVETARISVCAPADAFLFWEDSSTTNISPALFEKYTAPEIDAWGDIVHGAGKLLIHHACGHIRALLPLMAKTNIDMIESISPPPTGNVELWDAAALLPKHIGLIGGIEPTVFLNSTNDELEAYVNRLLDNMAGEHRYILANSDSCPPGVSLEKFRLVTQIVRERARG